MAKKKPPTQETNTNGPPLLDCQDFPEVLVRVEANLLRVIEKAGVSTDGLEALPDDAPGRVRDAAASIQFIRHLRAEATEDAEPWQMARLGFYLGATVGMTDTVHGMKTLRAIKEAYQKRYGTEDEKAKRRAEYIAKREKIREAEPYLSVEALDQKTAAAFGLKGGKTIQRARHHKD